MKQITQNFFERESPTLIYDINYFICNYTNYLLIRAFLNGKNRSEHWSDMG